jgi:hypothetical protein
MPTIIGRPNRYTLEVTGPEYSAICRALGIAGGYPIKVRSEDQKFSRELNKRLAEIRLQALRQEEKIVTDVLSKIDEFEIERETQKVSPVPNEVT